MGAGGRAALAAGHLLEELHQGLIGGHLRQQRADLQGGQTTQAPVGQKQAADQEFFVGAGGLEAVQVAEGDARKQAGVFAGEQEEAGGGPVAEGVEANGGLAFRGAGPGGFAGVAAIGFGRGHGLVFSPRGMGIGARVALRSRRRGSGDRVRGAGAD